LAATALAPGIADRLPSSKIQKSEKQSDSRKPGMYVHLEMVTQHDESQLKDFIGNLTKSLWRNWFISMPEAAQLGEPGKVVVAFQILNGASSPEPTVEISSGKRPLDGAATHAVRDATKKLKFPQNFAGSRIDFRAEFLYNLPKDSLK